VTINLNHVTDVLQSQVEVRVFIKGGTSHAAEMKLMHHAAQWPNVRKISFLPKDRRPAP